MDVKTGLETRRALLDSNIFIQGSALIVDLIHLIAIEWVCRKTQAILLRRVMVPEGGRGSEGTAARAGP